MNIIIGGVVGGAETKITHLIINTILKAKENLSKIRLFLLCLVHEIIGGKVVKC